MFVTGATGYIGNAVVRELAGAGHAVTGLTRSRERAGLIEEAGGRAALGRVQDPASYSEVAAEHDVLIHAAMEFSEETVAVDRAALDTLLAAAKRQPRAAGGGQGAFIYTSGCFVLGETGDSPADESAPTDGAPAMVAWRPVHEDLVRAAAGPELATAVIRPGMVYGGRGGTFGQFFAAAEESGAATYVGDGRNRWSPVYLGDVARLYRVVAERRASGLFHCTEGRGTSVEQLARAASAAVGKGGGTRAVPVAQARTEMGPFADALVMDQVITSPRAEALGWRHEHAPFVDSAAALYREWKVG